MFGLYKNIFSELTYFEIKIKNNPSCRIGCVPFLSYSTVTLLFNTYLRSCYAQLSWPFQYPFVTGLKIIL